MTQAKEELVDASQGMVITITILNSSSADLALTDGELTAGAWRGPPPTPNTPLSAGATSFVNVSQSTFGGAGGFITLVPAGGGSISLTWSWTPGQALMVYGIASGTSALVLSYSVAGASTYNPTITYLITDPDNVALRPGDWT